MSGRHRFKFYHNYQKKSVVSIRKMNVFFFFAKNEEDVQIQRVFLINS